jgi:CBS domain-containing protein
MVEEVISISVDATIMEAVKLMNNNNIGCLIVAKRGEALGIITERDILTRVIAKARNVEATRVSDVMSKPLILGESEMFLDDAVKMMFQEGIKKLPLMKNGELVGIVTLSDIARVTNIRPQITQVVEDLKQSGWLPSKKMKRVIDFYIA